MVRRIIKVCQKEIKDKTLLEYVAEIDQMSEEEKKFVKILSSGLNLAAAILL
jgi:hypothetical protein